MNDYFLRMGLGPQSLSGEPPEEFVVKLQTAGKVVGRLVDDDGKPLADLQLMPGPIVLSPSPAAAAKPTGGPEPPRLPLPPNRMGQAQYATDEDGRFAIDGLVPGAEYHLTASQRAGRRYPGSIEQAIQVKSGETLDLGDVKLRPPAANEPDHTH